MVVKQCSISGIRSEGTSCEVFIMFNVSFIGTCVKRDSMLKLISRFVEFRRTKSIELIMCDMDFPVRGCSVCIRKRDKLYGELYGVDNLRETFGLCTFVVRIVLVGEDL